VEQVLEPGAPEAPRVPVIIRTPRAANQLIADGPIVGIDGDPRTDEAMDPDVRQSPWYIIETFDDLDRCMAGVVAKEYHAAAALAEWARIKAQLAARREALLAKFAHLVPAPDEGKKWKATTGAASMGSYRHEPNRLPDLRVEGLCEHCAELDALGLVKYRPELSITETRKYIAAHEGKAPPHVVLVPKSPVTYSPPKQAAGLAAGISEVEPTPAAETQDQVAA
jgi:hypothetical protein